MTAMEFTVGVCSVCAYYHKEKEATHDVGCVVTMTVRKFLRLVFDIFEAREAAIMVVVVALQRTGVPRRALCEAARILFDISRA